MGADLKATALRAVNLGKGALTALGITSDGEPYARYTAALFPYWTARLDTINIDADSQDFDEYAVNVVLRLVIGHVTSGLYKGERDDELMTWIPHVIEYFNERELLTDDTYPTEIPELVSARIISCSGYREFQNTAVGGTQVGADFTLRCEFQVPIFQALA